MEAEKNELEDFLDEQLLQFITDDMLTLLPSNSNSHTHQQNYFVDTDDMEGILLEAIEQFEKASQQTFKSDSCSNTALRQFHRKEHAASRIPESTNRDTKYCAKMWEEWVINRAKKTGTVVPYLKDITIPQLQYWVCYFILEVCKKDGAEFPPNTLYHICCGIMRFVRTNGMNVDYLFAMLLLIGLALILHPGCFCLA